MRRALALAVAVAFSGCQDYRFNPVGICTLQPGQVRVPLASLSTADILFVVDDSGSMEPMQDNLRANFQTFIARLAATQADRAGRGLEPLDFHIAITTSSIFEAVAATGALCGGTPLTCNISAPVFPPPYSYACTTPGAQCADLLDKFRAIGSGFCTQGVAPGNGQPFPAGDFVALGANPKVLHFVKTLGWSTWGTDASGDPLPSVDPPLAALYNQFRQNVLVGSCGSGEEQHLEAGRLALEKALRLGGLSQPGVDPSEFPHPNSKLVVVWVGNEDDCSNPKDPATAIILSNTTPGADSCTSAQISSPQRFIPVADIAAFFAGLGRPFGAAFIYPGAQGATSFVPGACTCQAPYTCQGYGPGTRFKALANAFRNQGSSVVEASICDGSFASTLQQIADLIPPPEGLTLPTQPAAGEVTRLRIVDGAGKTVHVCTGPDAAGEWWFSDCTTGAPTGGTPTGSAPNTCLKIRSGSACEASPGQAYAADYLGRVPPDGCADASDCQAALGGLASAWVCDIAAGQTRGTCLCAPSQ